MNKQNLSEKIYDSIIIGSGPAGLTAAVYLKRAAREIIVVEKDHMGMGAVSTAEKIENYIGFPEINGFELGEKFRGHAISAGAEIINSEAVSLSKENGIWTSILKNGEKIRAKTIIYAAGTSHRKLDVKGNDLKGISYCAVCDGNFYKNKVCAVIGGGDTALGDALHLSEIASKVYLIHRRTSFRANRTLQNRIKGKNNIEVILNAVVTEIIGEKRVSSLKILINGSEEKTLSADGIFSAIGSIPNTDIVKNIVETDKNGYIKAGEDCVTSEAGFFAAGDVRTTPLRQIVTACADGAKASYSVEEYLLSEEE